MVDYGYTVSVLVLAGQGSVINNVGDNIHGGQVDGQAVFPSKV